MSGKDEARERRIEMEIVVDAYNEIERAISWHIYLNDNLEFPFRARCITERAISPLRVGEEVEATGMAPEEECEHEMFVEVLWKGRALAVPLAQLEGIDVGRQTREAIEDWHYWVERGYQF